MTWLVTDSIIVFAPQMNTTPTRNIYSRLAAWMVKMKNRSIFDLLADFFVGDVPFLIHKRQVKVGGEYKTLYTVESENYLDAEEVRLLKKAVADGEVSRKPKHADGCDCPYCDPDEWR